jgi:hypothetical protein
VEEVRKDAHAGETLLEAQEKHRNEKDKREKKNKKDQEKT